jgi:hypothetical protein
MRIVGIPVWFVVAFGHRVSFVKVVSMHSRDGIIPITINSTLLIAASICGHPTGVANLCRLPTRQSAAAFSAVEAVKKALSLARRYSVYF